MALDCRSTGRAIDPAAGLAGHDLYHITPTCPRPGSWPKTLPSFIQVVLGDSGTGITIFDQSTNRQVAAIPQGTAIRLDTEDNSTVVVTMPTGMELRGIYYINMDEGICGVILRKLLI